MANALGPHSPLRSLSFSRGGMKGRYISAASIAIGLATWEVCARLFVDPFFLPPASAVLVAAFELLEQGRLLEHVRASMFRILCGFLLGTAIAIPIGLLIGVNLTARRIVDPYIQFLRFVPVLGLTTLFLVWFGAGELSKILLVAYATGFTIVIGTVMGVVTTEQNQIRAAKMLGASRLQVLCLVTVQAASPSIYIAARIALSASFLVIVGVEMLAANSGIGYLIWSSRIYFRIDCMFVGVFLLAFLGLISDTVLKYIGRHILGRYVLESRKY